MTETKSGCCVVCGLDMSHKPFEAIYHSALNVVTCHKCQNSPKLKGTE
jgi:hypothetical protein